MRILPLALLILAVGAPTAAAAPTLGPQSYLGTRISSELDPKAEPTNRPADVGGDPLQVQSTYVGRNAIEPTIALDKQGNAFFPASFFEDPAYGAGGHAYLMRSSDQNGSWQDIEPATSVGADPPRDLDPWVYADPDTGRVFDIGLLVAGSYMSFSDDAGETWTSTFLSDPGINDHQSIVTAVPPAGNPTMVPRDPAFPKIVYYCVNGVARHGCSASRDGGVTFTSTGGSPYTGVDVDGDGFCGALTGHVQADGEGRLFIPSGRCGKPQISVSEDGGVTWQQVDVSAKVGAADTHSEVAVDKAGNLYYLWHDNVHFLPFMATSTDHGKSWSDPVMVAPPGVFSVNLPTIVAGEPGRVAMTWAGSTTADEEAQG
ncbi:MAG: sialidase family protein, partial [Actinomycetes bacterium]